MICDDITRWSDNFTDEFDYHLHAGSFCPDEWIDLRRDGLITHDQYLQVLEYYKGHYLFS